MHALKVENIASYIETEVILLNNIYDHINEMVNFALFKILGDINRCTIMFNEEVHRKYFFILLVDLLSKTDKNAPIEITSFLDGLAKICKTPQFSINKSETSLTIAVNALIEWIREKKEIDIWMPSLNQNVTISITRFDYIKMCGDVSKHNYLRAISVADLLKKILAPAIEITREQALLALPDFYERFHNDILIYLSSHICELLNNIRLGIYQYLRPEFSRSHCYTDNERIRYTYDTPKLINSEYARVSYWDLMNKIRMKPYMTKFTVSDSLKSRY